MLKYVVVILMVVPMLGGLNYLRNEPLDNDLENRTYAGLKDGELDQLIEAYQQQVGRVKEQVDDAPTGMNQIDRFGSADVGGKAAAFSTFQERNREWRRQRGAAFEGEGMIDQLKHEKKLRKLGVHTEYGRILRRVTTF